MKFMNNIKPIKPDLPDQKVQTAVPHKVERQERWMHIGGILTLLILFGGLGLWAALAPLDSAAMGPGVVVLEDYRKAVQHLEGGIVHKVHVREGQMVRAGEILISLEDVQPRAQMELINSQLLMSLAREARLIAQRDGKSQVVYPAQLLSIKQDQRVTEAIRVQDQTFKVRKQGIEGGIKIYERQISQLRQKSAGLREQKSMRDKLATSFEKDRADFEALANEGYAERQRVREMERNLAQSEGQSGSLITDIAASELEISATEIKIIQLEQDFQREVAKELAEVQTELFGLREKMRGLTDTLQRTKITAPDAGMVLGLSVHTIGEVLRPGAHILDIVPANEQLIVEAHLSPQDVDQVRVGQMAEVRFTAFRQRDMPKVEGKLVTLSADRLMDQANEQSQPYYLGRVVITPKGIDDLAALKLELVPGMPAEILVKTGTRTFWHYLTAPISDLLVRSLKED